MRRGIIAAAGSTWTIPSSNLIAWLKPGDFSGSTWNDSSGNGNHFTAYSAIQTTNPVNGQVIATLTNENYLTNYSSRVISAFTAIVVASPVGLQYGGRLLITGKAGSLDVSGPNSMINISEADPAVYPSRNKFQSYQTSQQTSPMAVYDKFNDLSIFVHRFGGGKLQNWQYAQGRVNASVEESRTFNMSSDLFCIGRYYNGTTFPTGYSWNGPLAETMLWDRALTNAEISLIIENLRVKYALWDGMVQDSADIGLSLNSLSYDL